MTGRSRLSTLRAVQESPFDAAKGLESLGELIRLTAPLRMPRALLSRLRHRRERARQQGA